MNRTIITNIILAVVLACTASSVTYGQEYISTPVTVSKEKVRVNGTLCYSHIVKEKQTLFSIAKAYDVTVDDIYRLNPSLKETGLKKNAIILIPSAEALSSAVQAETAEVAKTDKVETPETPQETKETTARPEVQPKKTSAKKQKTHTVKWYEDLDVIADRYGVTVEALMNANNLTGRKLTKRQKLIIPEPGDMPEIVTDADAAEIADAADDTLAHEDTTVTDSIEPDWLFAPKDEVKVTLILPMKASTESVSRNNMDFYSGVLLAVKDLADVGISTELNVYDSSDSTHPIASEDLEESDLVIGPVSSTDLGMLLGIIFI